MDYYNIRASMEMEEVSGLYQDFNPFTSPAIYYDIGILFYGVIFPMYFRFNCRVGGNTEDAFRRSPP